MDMQEPIKSDESKAHSVAAEMLGLAFASSLIVLMLMGLIKIGLIWFG